MTLLEILVKELKEWPEGVEVLTQSAYDTELYNGMDCIVCNFKAFSPRIMIDTKHNEYGVGIKYPYVTKDQWLIARGEKPEVLTKCAYVIRDTIIELEAYEEHFKRQRESLIGVLAGEGFALVDVVIPVEDFSDPELWQAGDWVECTFSASGCYTDGQCYQVEFIKNGMIAIRDNEHSSMSNSWCNQSIKNVTSNVGSESGFKFHRRGVL